MGLWSSGFRETRLPLLNLGNIELQNHSNIKTYPVEALADLSAATCLDSERRFCYSIYLTNMVGWDLGGTKVMSLKNADARCGQT